MQPEREQQSSIGFDFDFGFDTVSRPTSSTGRGPQGSRPARILLIEPEPTFASLVTAQLERRGHVVDLGQTLGVDAAIGANRPDLVILDIESATGDGLDLVRRLQHEGLPTLLLSPTAEGEDRVLALELGADDFVPSPPTPREVVARAQALLRRRDRMCRHTEQSHGPVPPRLVVDERAHRVIVDGAPVHLTSMEFRLLVFFLAHPGEALRREQLLEQVWGYTVGDCATVTVHVRRLRAKIEREPAHPGLIRTIWGTGYCFEPEPE